MNTFGALQPILDQTLSALGKPAEVYLVGGAVRDLLLGRPAHDLDFVLPQGAIRAARRAADVLGGDFYPLDTDRDTGRVLIKRTETERLTLDFAAFRGPDLEADLRDRDFTLNSIAINLEDPTRLIDPLGGVEDLRARRLRVCSPGSFTHDPVRILRAARLAVEYRLRIEPVSLQLLRADSPRLVEATKERVRDEFFKILEGSNPAAALRLLAMVGAIEPVFPELAALEGAPSRGTRRSSAWDAVLDTLRRMKELLHLLKPEHDPETAGSWVMGLTTLRLGRYRRQLHEHFSTGLNPNRSLLGLTLFTGLYLEIAPQAAVRRAADLRLSNVEIERAEAVIRGFYRLDRLADGALGETGLDPWGEAETALNPDSRAEVYRYFRDCGPAGIDACLLWLASGLADYGADLPQEAWTRRLNAARNLFESWWERRTERVAPPQLIRGGDLMNALGVNGGPEVGRLLEAIRTAQAAGLVSDRDQALNLALRLFENPPQG